jgi:hypothetical protein
MFILVEVKMKTEIWEEYGPNFPDKEGTPSELEAFEIGKSS